MVHVQALRTDVKTLSRLTRKIRASKRLSRIVDVGWLLEDPTAGFIYDAPRAVSRNDAPPKHAKSVAYCPAVLDHEARLFEVPCPFDLEIGCVRDDKGRPALRNLAGDMSAVRDRHLSQLISLMDQKEWRHPERPVLQIKTPYVFIADEPVYMTQMPPFGHFRSPCLPGTMIGGRLPIHIWPRQMMWAFEWYAPANPLSLKRGEPWFYVRFETHDPSRPVRLVEATLTPELEDYMRGLKDVTGYVQRTFSLFATAKQRRPKQLLVKRSR
jgi:hypothetical protein